ncbi:MAG: hypothetical protein ACR2IJ_08400 [Fluviibacter sp.]
MQIGLSSIVGDGFGVGSFHLSEVASEPAGFPPYGTILSTGTEYLTLNWAYTDTSSGSGNFNWGSYPYYTKADGMGGYFLDFTSGMIYAVETASTNEVIEGTNDASYRIIYKGGYGVSDPLAGTWNECLRTDYLTGNSGSGTVYIDVLDNFGSVLGTYTIGSYSYLERGNGTCGTYNDYTYDYSSYPYGTYLTSWFDSSSGSTYEAYTDGAGGYYTVQL